MRRDNNADNNAKVIGSIASKACHPSTASMVSESNVRFRSTSTTSLSPAWMSSGRGSSKGVGAGVGTAVGAGVGAN
eukprot:scaffold424765_cov17-Prasinocladus_malaysianus.AAC.1